MAVPKFPVRTQEKTSKKYYNSVLPFTEKKRIINFFNLELIMPKTKRELLKNPTKLYCSPCKNMVKVNGEQIIENSNLKSYQGTCGHYFAFNNNGVGSLGIFNDRPSLKDVNDIIDKLFK